MRSLFPLFAAFCLAAGAGCVRVTQDLVLERDGRGTLTITYGAKEQDIQRMRQVARQMAAIDPDLAPADVDWLTSFDEEAIRREWKKNAGPGVHLAYVTTGMEGPWRMMTVRLRFDSLQQLFDCGMVEDCHIALTRGPSGHYGYLQTVSAGRAAKALPPGMTMEHAGPMAAMLLQGLDATFRVTTPGRILKSNADRVENTTATWRITDQTPDLLGRLQSMEFRMMFDGRGLTIADARLGN